MYVRRSLTVATAIAGIVLAGCGSPSSGPAHVASPAAATGAADTAAAVASDAHRRRELAPSDQLSDVLRMKRDYRSKLGEKDEALLFECRDYVRLN